MSIAVIVPCYNEGPTIAAVVRGFATALPGASIYVFDNNSTDDTVAQAQAAGAVVRRETRQGKGNVVNRMFADVSADAYVLVDGDNTYDPGIAPQMIAALVRDNLDMVVASRASTEEEAYRFGHRFGNRLLTGCLTAIFGQSFTDILSGYRVFSRRFVKSFPVMSRGFEIETEFSVHALQLRMPTAELTGAYGARPEGSSSKLNTYGDGVKILATILTLFKDERPLAFFGTFCAVLVVTSVGLGIPVILEFLETGLVPRFPTAILATGLGILALVSLTCGIILDNVSKARREAKRLAYLAIAPVGA